MFFSLSFLFLFLFAWMKSYLCWKKSIRKNIFLEAATCKRERKMKRKRKKDNRKKQPFSVVVSIVFNNNKKKNTSTVHGYQGEWMQHDKDVIVIPLNHSTVFLQISTTLQPEDVSNLCFLMTKKIPIPGQGRSDTCKLYIMWQRYRP